MEIIEFMLGVSVGFMIGVILVDRIYRWKERIN